MTLPTPGDPEVAAIVFARDLQEAVESSEGRRRGWTYEELDALSAVVHLVAHGPRGDAADEYHLLLRGHYYDLWPPQGCFAAPPEDGSDEWAEAAATSTWLPRLDQAMTVPSFALHPAYQYPELPGFPGGVRQLLCCSMNLDYYISNHAPTDDQRWVQGKRKIIALVSRVADALDSDAYHGRAGC